MVSSSDLIFLCGLLGLITIFVHSSAMSRLVSIALIGLVVTLFTPVFIAVYVAHVRAEKRVKDGASSNEGPKLVELDF